MGMTRAERERAAFENAEIVLCDLVEKRADRIIQKMLDTKNLTVYSDVMTNVRKDHTMEFPMPTEFRRPSIFKRILKFFGLAVICAFILTGCGDDTDGQYTSDGVTYTDTPSEGYSEADVKLNDGRTVRCLHWLHGVSCDWRNAK